MPRPALAIPHSLFPIPTLVHLGYAVPRAGLPAPASFRRWVEAALRGAKQIIGRDRPILAICAYHLQNHLWEVPLLMSELLDRAPLALFSHCMDGFDTVCYAIPQERLARPHGDLR